MSPAHEREALDARWMRAALEEAEKAAAEDEVPVGAIVVRGGAVVARGHNRRESLQSPLAHAELAAIGEAAGALGTWRLNECELYVTLEPCIMCVGAILQARIARLVFGCLDPKGGAVRSLYRLCEDGRLNHRLPVTAGVLAGECAALLAGFFSSLRERKQSTRHAERWPSPAEGA
ncbi:MAG TPA: tRNA adenosine(34) deaminase TadA [candidate division Zixibacteria bacterium]|nr:tRNA adenosine(34) deaminase TadA [candidate division Zixibacteria bacterium]